MGIHLLTIDFQLTALIAIAGFIVGSIIYWKINNAINKFNFERENELLTKFLYDEKTIQDGYDTTNLGDFEKWKRNKKN